MKLYFIFTKRGLAVILAGIVLVLVVVGLFSGVNRGYPDGSTHQKRMEYLLPLRVCENAVSVKQSRLPEKIEGAILKYNEILIRGGFNLENFCGKQIVIYTYGLIDSGGKTVNLIICDGKIIAGDITDNLKGTITPIIKEK